MWKKKRKQPGECFGMYANDRACQECILKDRCRTVVLKDGALRIKDERRGRMKKILSVLILMVLVPVCNAETNGIQWGDLPSDNTWTVEGSVHMGTDIIHWQTMTNWASGWSREMAYAGQPAYSNVLTVLTNDAYLVGYSDEDECPLWVCYELLATTSDAPTRPSMSFKTDKRTKAKVKTGDYTNTGYDRGHMAPSYGIGLSHGTNAQRQTFLMSNVIPQTPELNRGIWKKLEQKAAKDWAQSRGKLWVITGPVFAGTNWVNGIRVPIGSFKVLVDESPSSPEVKVMAFLMPQNPLEDATLGLYLTSVDEIERQTGLDLMPELPDHIEDEVERGTW
jgi:endonuclease G